MFRVHDSPLLRGASRLLLSDPITSDNVDYTPGSDIASSPPGERDPYWLRPGVRAVSEFK